VQVQQIVLTADIQLQAANWQRSDPNRLVVAANRNITLSSQPPYHTLDFAFLGNGWLRMAPDTQLTLSQLVVIQSRCAACPYPSARTSQHAAACRLHPCPGFPASQHSMRAAALQDHRALRQNAVCYTAESHHRLLHARDQRPLPNTVCSLCWPAANRYGVGMQLDFLAPSPSAFLVLNNTAIVRHLCISNLDEPEVIVSVPRIPGVYTAGVAVTSKKQGICMCVAVAQLLQLIGSAGASNRSGVPRSQDAGRTSMTLACTAAKPC
jgi:hypothetical protein